MNMKLIFLTILFSLVTSTSFAQSSAIKKKSAGKLSGIVLDEVEAIVRGAKIIVEGKKFRREIKSNEDGYYEFWLPKGNYEIRIPEENGF